MSLYPQTVIQSNIVTIYQGADYSETVTIVDDATGAAIPNFAAATVVSKLRDLSGNLAASFTCTVTGPTTFTRTLNETQTAALTSGTAVNHVWGIKITLADGTDLPEFQGGGFVMAAVC